MHLPCHGARRQRPFVGWPVTGCVRPVGRLRLPQTALVHDRAMLDCLRQNRRRTLMKTSMRFDLVDLRLFLLVVEAANITHGAARSGMALASASERIRLMEESLGAALLERHRRGVRATPAGAALAHHAQLVTQQLERMRGNCRNMPTASGGACACSPIRRRPRSSFPLPWLHSCRSILRSTSIWRSVPAA